MATSTESAPRLPRSPCAHSAAWTKCARIPVEASDAAKRRATAPDLPSAVTRQVPPVSRTRCIAAAAPAISAISGALSPRPVIVAASACSDALISALISAPAAQSAGLPAAGASSDGARRDGGSQRAASVPGATMPTTRSRPEPSAGGRPPSTLHPAVPAALATARTCVSSSLLRGNTSARDANLAAADPSADSPIPRCHSTAISPPKKASPAPVVSRASSETPVGGGGRETAVSAEARAPPSGPSVTASSGTPVTRRSVAATAARGAVVASSSVLPSSARSSAAAVRVVLSTVGDFARSSTSRALSHSLHTHAAFATCHARRSVALRGRGCLSPGSAGGDRRRHVDVEHGGDAARGGGADERAHPLERRLRHLGRHELHIVVVERGNKRRVDFSAVEGRRRVRRHEDGALAALLEQDVADRRAHARSDRQRAI